jgi:hypothetical protein
MKNNLASYIDRLGEIKAEMAKLKTKETKLKAVLIEQGPGSYEGNLFRATVSKGLCETLDLKEVRKKLSPKFIRSITTTTDVTTVKVVARNGIKLVA